MKAHFPSWKKIFSYALILVLALALMTTSASAQTNSSSSAKKQKKKSGTITKKVKKKKVARKVLATQVNWRTKTVYRNGKATKVRYRYIVRIPNTNVKPSPPASVAQPTPAPAPVVTPVPVVVTPPAPAPAPAPSNSQVDHIISLINAERRANGLAEVRTNGLLNQAAAAKSKHMSDKNYFAHTAPDGTTDWSFINNVGYKYANAGANLAMGDFGNDEGLVRAWMNSPGHRANILAPFGQEIGIGIHGQYYTMFIAKPM